MFPIRDHNPSGRTPYVTYALIAINIVVFLVFPGLFGPDPSRDHLYLVLGAVPSEVAEGRAWLPLLTSTFVHAGFLHLAGNMLFLYIFGDNMEDEMGHVGFLLFYLVAGIGAGLIHVFSAPYSNIPIVGASGAIAGVMGGYMLLFPKAKVDILLILIIFFKVIPIPAWIMLAVWFGFQLLGGLGSDPQSGGVAYWAHTGGFVLGLVLTLPLWLRLGGIAFWNRNHGHPPHPETQYRLSTTRIPRSGRR